VRFDDKMIITSSVVENICQIKTSSKKLSEYLESNIEDILSISPQNILIDDTLVSSKFANSKNIEEEPKEEDTESVKQITNKNLIVDSTIELLLNHLMPLHLKRIIKVRNIWDLYPT